MLLATVAIFTLSCAVAPLPIGAATTTTTAPLPDVLNGVSVGPAVVTSPGKPTRHLTANQNTAFLQTWLGASIVTRIGHDDPPSCLPVFHMRSTITNSHLTTPLVVYYATDGTTAWVGMPPQSLGFASVSKLTWIRSPEAGTTIAAFAGDVAAIDISGGSPPQTVVPNPTATTIVCAGETVTPTRPVATAKSSSSRATWEWFAIPGAIVVGGLGVWLLTRSRSRAA